MIDLARALKEAGYRVLNSVSWKHDGDATRWLEIRRAFAVHFPKLADAA